MRPSSLLCAAAVLLGAALLLARRHHQQQQEQERRRFLSGRAPLPQYRAAPLVLVVDIGSSSVRASCYALLRDGGSDKRDAVPVWVLLEGSLQQLPLAAIDQHGEADIAQLAASVESLVDDVLAFLRSVGLASQLVGVGFSTFAMNLLGVNAVGVPVTPVYTYAGRRPSTAAHARQLRKLLTVRGSLAEFYDRTGTVIHPAYAPAEFLRLHAEEPERVQRVHKWQSISGFLVGKWTRAGEKSNGCMPMSFSEASWTGLFDFRHWQWDRALLALVHMDVAKMPPLADSSTPFVGLSPAFAQRWPELRTVPFFLGIGDGAAANVGSKCIDSSRVAVTIGTSAAVRVVVESSTMRSTKVPTGLWCYRIGRDHLLLGGALNDGGSVYEFFRKTLQISDDDLRTKLQRVRANHHGLKVLPFLSGERSPGWVEEATCTISGITKWTTPVEVLYAALESVALRISLVFSLLASHADSDAVVVASGTALTASPMWRQMLADAMGKDLVMEKDVVETTSRGVAMFLGSYLGLHTLQEAAAFPSPTSDGRQPLLVSRPDAVAHAAHLEARHAQEFLYRKLHTEA